MNSRYKVLSVRGSEGIVVDDECDSNPPPYHVKICAHYSLVSTGTEYHYLRECAQNGASIKLGYCSSGVVEALGADVNIDVKVGDRVIAMGWQKATHAEKIFVPQNLCCRIPNHLPFEDAVFANLGATAMHAIHRAELVENDVILVVGGGLVGQLVALYAKLSGASVFLSDLLGSRMQIASNGGVDIVPMSEWTKRFSKSLTKVFLCISGDADSLFFSLFPLINPIGNGYHRSKIIGVGRFTAKIDFNVAIGNIDIIFAARCGEGYRDIEYETGQKDVGTVRQEKDVRQNLKDCISLLENQRISVRHLHSLTIPFSDLPNLYLSTIKDKNNLGILIKYQL